MERLYITLLLFATASGVFALPEKNTASEAENQKREQSTKESTVEFSEDDALRLRAKTPVVITASRNPEKSEDEVIPVETIPGAYLAQSGSSNIAEALAYQPGLYVSYNALRGDTVQVGGLPPEYSLILINGRRVIGKNEEATSINRLNLNDVDRIEILKGAGSAIYGSEAVGGVINIITRTIDAPVEYKVSAGGGELGKFNLDAMVGTKHGIFSNKTDVSFRQLDEYSISSSDPKLMGRGFGNWQISDQMQFDVSKKWQVGLDLNAVDRRERGVSKTTGYINESKLSQLASGTLFSKSQFSATQSLNVDLNYSYFDDTYAQDFQNPLTKDTSVRTKENYASALFHYNWLWASNQSLTLGMENIGEKMVSDRIAGSTPNSPGEKERFRYATYAENKWVIVRSLNMILQPALRYDYVEAHSDAVSPRLGFRIDPLSTVTLQAGYGWGFRAPSLKELNYDFSYGPIMRVQGNPNLKSEKSQSYNAGVIWKVAPWLTLASNGYYHIIRDKITRVLDHTSGMTQFYSHVNADYVESKSAELQAEFRLYKYFTLRTGYTYTDAIAQYTTTDAVTKITSSMVRTLDGQAAHTGSATFIMDYRPWGLKLSVSALVIGERPVYNKLTRTTEARSPYNDLQARISKEIARGVSAFISAENLTNNFNETDLIRPPRSFWGGVIVQNF